MLICDVCDREVCITREFGVDAVNGLGGRLGRLVCRHGLALDNLMSADVVTADGKLFRPGDASMRT